MYWLKLALFIFIPVAGFCQVTRDDYCPRREWFYYQRTPRGYDTNWNRGYGGGYYYYDSPNVYFDTDKPYYWGGSPWRWGYPYYYPGPQYAPATELPYDLGL